MAGGFYRAWSSYFSTGSRGRATQRCWTQPGDIYNGLTAQTWAALIDAGAGEIAMLLGTLRDADIAAYAAGIDGIEATGPPVFRIWVDLWAHNRAADVIREALREPEPATDVRIEVALDYIIILLYLVIHRWWERKILPWLDREPKNPDNIPAWKVLLRRGCASGVGKILGPIWSVLQPDSSGGIKTLKMLKIAVMSSLGYSIISVVLGSAPVLFSVAAWNPAHLMVDVIIGGTVTWVLLITLLPLAALLAPAYGPQYPPLKECVVCKERLGRATHVIPA